MSRFRVIICRSVTLWMLVVMLPDSVAQLIADEDTANATLTHSLYDPVRVADQISEHYGSRTNLKIALIGSESSFQHRYIESAWSNGGSFTAVTPEPTENSIRNAFNSALKQKPSVVYVANSSLKISFEKKGAQALLESLEKCWAAGVLIFTVADKEAFRCPGVLYFESDGSSRKSAAPNSISLPACQSRSERNQTIAAVSMIAAAIPEIDGRFAHLERASRLLLASSRQGNNELLTISSLSRDEPSDDGTIRFGEVAYPFDANASVIRYFDVTKKFMRENNEEDLRLLVSYRAEAKVRHLNSACVLLYLNNIFALPTRGGGIMTLRYSGEKSREMTQISFRLLKTLADSGRDSFPFQTVGRDTSVKLNP